MADHEHLEILKSGVEKWNKWREERPDVRPNLSGAGLSGADLSGADLVEASLTSTRFKGANLSATDLSHANLQRSDLSHANLSFAKLPFTLLQRAKFSGANLLGANLFEANLRAADLRGVDLSNAYLRGADLAQADLTRAGLWGADFSRADLSRANLTRAQVDTSHLHHLDLRKVQGLETIEHFGPSAVSSQTLEMSKGQLPDKFLKGCGFADWMIESAKLCNPDLRADEVIDLTYRIADMRTEAPIVPRSIFISYSNKDMGFIEKLESRFDDDGIRSWRDVKDMVAGPIEPQIDRAIGAQKVVLLVISRNSIRSDWVEWEVRRARELQKDLQERAEGTVHVLCPVAIDRSWWESNPWPGRLRAQVEEYNIVDLSEWEDAEAFETQYQKLKKGLGIYYRDEGE